MASAFYLGVFGNMIALPGPVDGLDASAERFGGIHRALDGTPTVDRLGRKRTWRPEWVALTADQLAFLASLHQGIAAGQSGSTLRLLDPMIKNRVPPQMASGGSYKRSTAGFTATAGTLAWAAAPFPDPAWQHMLTGLISWSIGASTAGTLKTSTAAADRIPLLTGEQVTASAYVSSDRQVRMQIIPYDASGAALTAVSGTTSTPGGFLQPISVSLTPSSTQVSCVIAVDALTAAGASTLGVTALQLEASASRTGWVPGEGCPVVIPADMGDSYLLNPYHTVKLTLLEV